MQLNWAIHLVVPNDQDACQAWSLGHPVDDGEEWVDPVVGQDDGRKSGRSGGRLLQEERTPDVGKDVPVEVVLGVVRKDPVIENVERRCGHRANAAEVTTVDGATLVPELGSPLLRDTVEDVEELWQVRLVDADGEPLPVDDLGEGQHERVDGDDLVARNRKFQLWLT